jgi:hypothetical protein
MPLLIYEQEMKLPWTHANKTCPISGKIDYSLWYGFFLGNWGLAISGDYQALIYMGRSEIFLHN